jgi:uncharacterized protein (DUF305 family)
MPIRMRALAPAAALLTMLLAACSSYPAVREPLAASQPAAALVQPGAPGQATLAVDPALPGERPAVHTEADVRFMQGMIAHHAQALVMTAMVPDREPSDGLSLLAQRIEASQTAEIRLMQQWLRRRGEEVPQADDPHRHHAGHGAGMLMPGMLTDAQLDEMRAASGPDFERLFLSYMISHHEGALTMVEELFASERAAQDVETYRFASDVDADQRMEIRRMRAMLRGAETPDTQNEPHP